MCAVFITKVVMPQNHPVLPRVTPRFKVSDCTHTSYCPVKLKQPIWSNDKWNTVLNVLSLQRATILYTQYEWPPLLSEQEEPMMFVKIQKHYLICFTARYLRRSELRDQKNSSTDIPLNYIIMPLIIISLTVINCFII